MRMRRSGARKRRSRFWSGGPRLPPPSRRRRAVAAARSWPAFLLRLGLFRIVARPRAWPGQARRASAARGRSAARPWRARPWPSPGRAPRGSRRPCLQGIEGADLFDETAVRAACARQPRRCDRTRALLAPAARQADFQGHWSFFLSKSVFDFRVLRSSPSAPALSALRERRRTLLPLAGEGGAKRRMRAYAKAISSFPERVEASRRGRGACRPRQAPGIAAAG